MGEKKNELRVDPTLYGVIQKCVTVGVNEGVKNALIEIEREKEEKKKHRVDMRYKNTRLLLRYYTSFKAHTSDSIYSETQLSKEELMDVLDLDMDEKITEVHINSIIKSKNKTNIILKHIDTFLDYYKYKCEQSNREDIRRRYLVIKNLYLVPDEKKFTQENLSGFLHCSDRTIRTAEKLAIKELAVLFFGIDGLKIR